MREFQECRAQRIGCLSLVRRTERREGYRWVLRNSSAGPTKIPGPLHGSSLLLWPVLNNNFAWMRWACEIVTANRLALRAGGQQQCTRDSLGSTAGSTAAARAGFVRQSVTVSSLRYRQRADRSPTFSRACTPAHASAGGSSAHPVSAGAGALLSSPAKSSSP